MDTEVPFLKIEDAKDMQASIDSLVKNQDDIKKMVTSIYRQFNPEYDGEVGILQRVITIEKAYNRDRWMITGAASVVAILGNKLLKLIGL